MMDTSIKVHACCRFSGPVADCALDLYRQGVRAKDVKKITSQGRRLYDQDALSPEDRKRRPKTHVDAQFSLPWAIAVAICKNSTGIDEFRGEALDDPEVLALAEKVGGNSIPAAEAVYPKAYPATLIAELNDGRTYQAHVDYPKGDPENPTTKEEMLDKFNSLTEKFFDRKKRQKIIATVNRLEKLSNIAKLADLVR